MQRRQFLRQQVLRTTGAASLLLAAPRVRSQAAGLPFRFNTGWKFESTHAGYLLALQRGYYREAGLNCVIDAGNGSAAAISLVAAGAYDCVSADLATMIEFNVNNPAAALKTIAIQYDRNPSAILVREDGPIARPADLAGRAILGQPFNATRKFFPCFARAQGFDPSTVQWQNVAPDIGNARFVDGDFDAVAYFYFTGLLNLKARGLPPERIRQFRYADFGVRSYGNGLIANPRSLERTDAMEAFVAASTRGWVEAIADSKAGAAAVKAREPQANEQIELERLELVVDSMRTAGTRANGWGAATADRLAASIEETVEAFGLKSTPTVDNIWTDRFLPPAAARRLKPAGR